MAVTITKFTDSAVVFNFTQLAKDGTAETAPLSGNDNSSPPEAYNLIAGIPAGDEDYVRRHLAVHINTVGAQAAITGFSASVDLVGGAYVVSASVSNAGAGAETGNMSVVVQRLHSIVVP